MPPNVQLYSVIIPSFIKKFFMFWQICFQSRLLQIFCMWERVKLSFLPNIPQSCAEASIVICLKKPLRSRQLSLSKEEILRNEQFLRFPTVCATAPTLFISIVPYLLGSSVRTPAQSLFISNDCQMSR